MKLTWTHDAQTGEYRSQPTDAFPKGKYRIVRRTGPWYHLLAEYEESLDLFIGTADQCKGCAEACENSEETDAVAAESRTVDALVTATHRGAAAAERLRQLVDKGAPSEMIELELGVVGGHVTAAGTALERLR